MSQIVNAAHFVTEIRHEPAPLAALCREGLKGQVVTVTAYDEGADRFTVRVNSIALPEGEAFQLPAALLPFLIRECGEPDEFVGRQFILSYGF
jgi:hypothetical protein